MQSSSLGIGKAIDKLVASNCYATPTGGRTMELLSTLIALLSLVVLIAALFNPLRPLDDGAPATRTADETADH
jgi:hypothetical protein